MNKWKLYLYYRGALIKKIRINANEEPNKNSYPITIWFKKYLFGTNKISLVVRPELIIKNDEKSKKTYWEVSLEKGIQV